MGAEKNMGREPPPTFIFHLDLTLKQRIWLLFLLPTAMHCIVYIADVATDIALVERHYAESHCLLSCLTLVLIYAPPLIFLILTLKDKRRWPSKDKGTGKRTTWVVKQLLLFILFPIHAMHRFAGKLFWALEALVGPIEQLEESLAEAMKPSNAELYLLLQPFLQAMPQVLLQSYVVMSYKVPQERIGAVQILSILTSLLSMAIAAAVYMRFESQRLGGRTTPWAFEKRNIKIGLGQKESLMTTIDSQITSETGEDVPDPEGSPKPPPLPKGVPQTAILSLPPLPPNIRARLLKASGDDLPEDLKKEVTEDKQPLNIRSSLYNDNAGGHKDDMESLDFSITLPPLSPMPPRTHSPDDFAPPLSPDHSLPPSPLPPLPPSPPDGGSPLHEPLPPLPDSPPPSPELDPDDESYEGSVHEAPTNEATGTTTPDTNLDAHTSREPLVDQSTATIPEKSVVQTPHVTEKQINYDHIYIEGLDETEMLCKMIAFAWWFFFILSRILTLSTLAFFYPVAFAVISVLHYLGMTSYLFSCGDADRTSTKILRFALGFVYLFCFIEIRDRFRDARNFAVGFVALCTLENAVSSGIWFLLGTWTSWWYSYSFYTINISLMLSFIAMALYHVCLQMPTQKNVN